MEAQFLKFQLFFSKVRAGRYGKDVQHRLAAQVRNCATADEEQFDVIDLHLDVLFDAQKDLFVYGIVGKNFSVPWVVVIRVKFHSLTVDMITSCRQRENPDL